MELSTTCKRAFIDITCLRILQSVSQTIVRVAPPAYTHASTIAGMSLPRLLRRSAGPLASLPRAQPIVSRSFTSSSWRRKNAVQQAEDSLASLPGIDASKLTVTETITPKQTLPPEDLIFGRTFTGTGICDLLQLQCPY